MKKSQGFILMETITMSILFLVSFSFIYISVNNYIAREKQRVYYDDVATIYQAYYIKEALGSYTNLQSLKDFLFINENYSGCFNTYGCIIGSDVEGLFINGNDFYSTINSLNLYQMFFTNDINNLKRCARNISFDDKCQKTYLDEELRAFINTINVSNENTEDLTNKHFFIFIFKRDMNGNSCNSKDCFAHYTWVPL